MSEAARSTSPSAWLRQSWRRIAPLLVVCGFYFGILVYPIVRIWTLFTGLLPGTAVLLLIMVLLMENSRRGLFFGKRVGGLVKPGQLVRKYHGYVFSGR